MPALPIWVPLGVAAERSLLVVVKYGALQLSNRRPTEEETGRMAKSVSMIHQPKPSDDRPIATSRRTFLPTFAIAAVSSAFAAPVLGHAEQPTQSETGTVSWNELRTRKPAEARAFYAGVVGWTPKVDGGYTTFAVGDNEVAGVETIGDGAPTDMRPAWLPFIQVKNVDEAAKRAVQLGGRIVTLPYDTENERMVELEDPEGNQFGLVSPRA